mgnify:CR=1 FL=1
MFLNYYMFISLSLIFFHNINILNFLSENIEQIDVKYSDKIYKYFKDESLQTKTERGKVFLEIMIEQMKLYAKAITLKNN